ncbi:protein of unknown function (plasmid) [Caballeronia sp. S22]
MNDFMIITSTIVVSGATNTDWPQVAESVNVKIDSGNY